MNMEITINDVLDHIENPIKTVIIHSANVEKDGSKSCFPEELEKYEKSFRIRKFSINGRTIEFDLL